MITSVWEGIWITLETQSSRSVSYTCSHRGRHLLVVIIRGHHIINLEYHLHHLCCKAELLHLRQNIHSNNHKAPLDHLRSRSLIHSLFPHIIRALGNTVNTKHRFAGRYLQVPKHQNSKRKQLLTLLPHLSHRLQWLQPRILTQAVRNGL